MQQAMVGHGRGALNFLIADDDKLAFQYDMKCQAQLSKAASVG